MYKVAREALYQFTMSSFPACTVCHQQFSRKGPAPFLLPCLHAVCETCVTSAAGGVISCSPCQRDVNLTETSLEKDVVREKEILHLTVKHHPELVMCTHEEDGNQAVCWCRECEDFFCENCQMVHNSFKGTRRHTVLKIEELEVDSFDDEKYCTVHPKLIADTMDEDCEMLTCLKCRREDHAEHRVVSVEENADLVRKKLTTLQEDLKRTIDKCRIHLAAAEKSLSALEQTYKTLPDKITHTFLSLRTLIDQREKELQIELQQLEEMSGGEREKKNLSETCLRRCLIASDYISKTLQYLSMHDLLELRILDKENPLNYGSSASSGDSRPCPLPVFNTQGLEMIKSTLAKFGTIATENDVFIRHIEDRETQTDEDLTSQKLESLAEEIKNLKSSREKLIREKENAEDALANLLERSSPDQAETDVDQAAASFKPPASMDVPAGPFSESSEFSLQDFEKDIRLMKRHQELEVKEENVDKIWADLSLTSKLIDRLLEEREGDFLMKRQEELQMEYFRQQTEIERLKKQRMKLKPLVSVHILSAWRSLPIEDIAARISSVLARQKIDMRFNIVTSPAKVAPNSRPLLVLCVNNSQLDTDVAHALKSIRVDNGVCLVVLHHKDQHGKAPKNSEKVLSAARSRSPSAVADMVFWKKKGLYHCGQNDGAAAKIAYFLARHARP